jgi:hypothetical protein
MREKSLEGWVTVFSSGTDYEADLVRDRLDDGGLDAVILTRRDHAFNLNVGELANVAVLVPARQADEARRILSSARISDADLERAALAADPDAPSAHDEDEQSMLDTGIDRIKLSKPDDE